MTAIDFELTLWSVMPDIIMALRAKKDFKKKYRNLSGQYFLEVEGLYNSKLDEILLEFGINKEIAIGIMLSRQMLDINDDAFYLSLDQLRRSLIDELKRHFELKRNLTGDVDV